MKKIILSIAFALPVILFAQNVAINNDGSPPDNNAILDIKSSSKGVLMPRLTTAERTGIISAVPGLTVFDSETFSYWIYRGELNGGWSELLSTFDKHWERTGTTVYNNNPGNIGIGTNNPTQKLAINATNPTIDFMHAGTSKGYLQANGSDMRIGTYANNTTGNIVFNTKAVDRMWIDENGKVGINTSTPSGALTIDGNNPWIEMRTGGEYKGYLWAYNNDMRVGTSITNTTGKLVFQTKLLSRMLIDENGKVGIGTITPSTALTINGVDPKIQLRDADVNKGFIHLTNDNLKIGLDDSNPNGAFIVHTAGADRMFVNYEGKVGIGTSNMGYSLLSVGENDYGSAGIDFRTALNGTRAIFAFGSNSGSLTQYGGTLKIATYGEGFILQSNGNFSMGGTAAATGYRLSVHGKAIATEFTAQAIINWPDYVFAADYKLKPLAEVKKFIAENKHLPNIPSAAAIEKDGIQLGDMSNRLMEKVEELTLYIIQLSEQNTELKKQFDELKKNSQK